MWPARRKFCKDPKCSLKQAQIFADVSESLTETKPDSGRNDRHFVDSNLASTRPSTDPLQSWRRRHNRSLHMHSLATQLKKEQSAQQLNHATTLPVQFNLPRMGSNTDRGWSTTAFRRWRATESKAPPHSPPAELLWRYLWRGARLNMFIESSRGAQQRKGGGQDGASDEAFFLLGAHLSATPPAAVRWTSTNSDPKSDTPPKRRNMCHPPALPRPRGAAANASKESVKARARASHAPAHLLEDAPVLGAGSADRHPCEAGLLAGYTQNLAAICGCP